MNYPALIDGTFQTAAIPANDQWTVNWYVAPMEGDGAATRKALYPTPGVETINSYTSGVGRGHLFVNGREFAVFGPSLVEITAGGSMTLRGTVAVDDNPATLCANGQTGNQILVTSGGVAYTLTLSTNAFAAVPSPTWAVATMGGFLDGYFIILDASTSTVYASALLDGTSWNALSFARRNLASDPLVAMYVLGRYLWLLGDRTSEVWYDTGGTPFPFAPYAVGLVLYGCAAPFSGAFVGDNLSWLSQNNQGGYAVVSVSAFEPSQASTISLSEIISGYSRVSDAVADSYSDQGHAHYLITFPSAGTTWNYTLTGQSWSQRGTWISEKNAFDVWRPRFHAFAFGEHRMLSADGPTLYRMSSSLGYDVGGRVIRRVRRAPILQLENKRLTVHSLELDVQPGLGNVVDPGSDPQVMLRMSRDGGMTWGTEQMRSAGKQGQYGKRVRWNRLGQARRFQAEFSVSDPTPWRVLNGYIEMSGVDGKLAQQAVR